MLEIIKNEEELASCYFADNDLIAVGAIKALKENGYRIPQDIGIVGFDNLPLGSVIEPALTKPSMSQNSIWERLRHKSSLIFYIRPDSLRQRQRYLRCW